MTDTEREIKHMWVAHNDDEIFDHVELTSIERWKESELSGDEWRFTYQAQFYSHGVLMTTKNGGSVKDCATSAAHWFNHPRKEIEEPETTDKWKELRAKIEERCAQPRCPEYWVVLYHPIKRYTQRGISDGMHWDARTDKSGLNWLAVRGFCEKHRHRGDCDLEDNDDNYEVIEERYPPGWNTD
jgi:hypothetical protein